MKQRQEPIFWVSNRCHRCNHYHSLVYTPDLLNGPIQCSCTSVNNPCRVGCECYAEWDFAATREQLEIIKENLKLAEQQDLLYAQIKRNREKLGYKDL